MNRWKNCPKSELSVRERSTLSLWKGLRATLKLLLPLRGPEQSPILDMRAPRYAPNVPEESSNTISKIQSINKSRADLSPVRYAIVLAFGGTALALAEISGAGCCAPAMGIESMPIGQGAPGSKSPATAGLKTYRRSQTATFGGCSVAKNASLPVLSISQNGRLGSPA